MEDKIIKENSIGIHIVENGLLCYSIAKERLWTSVKQTNERFQKK